ncbi:MAG: hypothetical protein GY925_04095 [Actinomycetia bacterium]|nr:hypothetical protein [Actinomycetes bacterium]
MRWVPRFSRRVAGRPQLDVTTATDIELIVSVPYEEWAFPEFYRRRFFGLAGFIHSRVDDVEVAHCLANEAMALGFEFAVELRRPGVVDPTAWIYELGLQLIDQFREEGHAPSAAASRVGTDLRVPRDRYDRIEREARLVMGSGALNAER